jgi:anti-sigma regulatory factor (Ser/Thr protein kinase)/GNAT superfamily N-acetyltransferase
MPAVLHTELTLPADARLLRLAADYVRGLTDLAGLSSDQAENLAVAVREACSNVVQHAYDADDAGTITLAAVLTPAALTISVGDRGLPFDQALEAEFFKTHPDGAARIGEPRQGLSLIHQGADQVRWLNHGPEGKELRFTTYRTGLCRLEPPLATAGSGRAATVEGGARHYDIRLMRPEDAERGAQLMYRVYGYTYSEADFYYPERIAHDLKTGRHVGVVAVAGDGEIAGHAGIMRPELGPLAELGQLAVAPAHRGQGLRRRLGDRLQEEIQRLGLIGLFAEAVTLHTLSQEASEGRGLTVTAIKLLDWQAHFKNFRTGGSDPGKTSKPAPAGPHRETMVLYFKYLAPPALKKIVPPARHREMLAEIYGALGAQVEFLQPSHPAGQGQLEVHHDRTIGVGTIQVNRIGRDTLTAIRQARRDLCAIDGVVVVGLDVPLAQAGAPGLCHAAEQDGFVFSGVRPHAAADGDFLRLQYVNAPLEPGAIRLASPFAKKMLAYVLQELARVADHPGT